MRKLSAAMILAVVAVGGCFENSDDPQGIDARPTDGRLACSDPPPASCEEMVSDIDECRPLSDFPVCGSNDCWVWECCICQEDGTWNVQFTECLNCNQPFDAPQQQPDGCGAFDAGIAPHC